MGLIENVKTIAKTFGRFVYHNRADIAFYGGLVGSAVGTGLIVKGAVKSQPALVEYKEKKKQITEASDLSEEEKKKLSTENTVTTLKTVGKNVAPGIIVEAASKGAEIYGHHTLHTELDGATTLANTLAASIALIHERVVADQGEDKWREYAYGQNLEQVEVVDTETGEVTTEQNVTFNGEGINDFSRDFSLSTKYSDTPHTNKHTLMLLKDCWNNKLHMYARPNDKVFLRDVWENVFGSLDGFKEEWANAGWIYEDIDGTTMSIEFWPKVEEMDAQTYAFWHERSDDVRIVFNCYPNVYYIEKLKKQRAKNK